MNYKLRTSKKAEGDLKTLQNNTRLQPFLLARLAISLSLKEENPVDVNEVKDITGLEFNRNTLTGEYDGLYKSLVVQRLGRPLTDEEFFPGYVKAHLERGLPLLSEYYQYAGNVEKFTIHLSRL